MPKPRADSKLASLPENQREMLRRWLVDENLSYAAARARLREDFGVETSERALSRFYATECFSDRFREAGEFADRVAESLRESPDKFDEATIALLKQKAFERAVAKDGNLKELQILANILGDTARLKLKRDELTLNLEKFRQAVKSDIEKGLDALFAEIKGNAAAEALFAKLKAAVLQSVDGKEAA